MSFFQMKIKRTTQKKVNKKLRADEKRIIHNVQKNSYSRL